MKSLAWTMAVAALAVATPAMAAAGEKSDSAVWIALGVVFMGSFTALIGALLILFAKKKSASNK